jgi:hypothetical protein
VEGGTIFLKTTQRAHACTYLYVFRKNGVGDVLVA